MPPKAFRHSNRVGNVTKFSLLLVTVITIFSSQLATALEMAAEPGPRPGTRIYVSATLPPAQVGVPYSGGLGVRGGIAPYSFSTTGTLPPGVSLDPNTGVFSGTPSVAGTFYFAGVATDSAGDVGDHRLYITVAPAGQVTVQISPSNATIASGGSQQFSANVNGASNTSVIWSTTGGSISSSGVLTAPTVSATSYVTVTAASAAAPLSKASATVTVTAVSTGNITVSVNPLSASMASAATQQFSATVSGTSNTLVIWYTSAGSISANGVLTAPSVSSTSRVTVTAKSAVHPDSQASASVLVNPSNTPVPVSVSVAPGTATVQTNGLVQFSAAVNGSSNTAVTWTAGSGSIGASGLYTAPPSATTDTVVATSAADPTKSASATVTVQSATVPVSVSLVPGTAVVQTQGSVQFSATVTGSNNTAVTWTAGIGSISSSGMYTAPASAATDTVIATSMADPTKAASATVTVQASTGGGGGGGGTVPVNPSGNAYCTPNGTWSGGATDGPASLPTQCMYTPVSGTPSPGVVHGPDSSTSTVQADINAAACGDTILVSAGSSLGTITLPGKSCDNAHWITIKSTGASSSSFPVEGQRMTPCWSGIASMPNRPAYGCNSPQVLTFKIVTPASSNGVAVHGGDHYRIIGAEITRVSTGGVPIYALADLSSSSTQTNNIVFDRVWFHGINQDGHFPMASQSVDTSTTRAIYLGQSNHIAVIDSYLSDFYDTGSMSANGNTDAQCVAGGFGGIPNSGWGVYKFVNNHCEASGEGILLGGAGGPRLTPTGCTVMVNCALDTPTDIEVRENYFFKPLSWNGNTGTVNTVGWPVVKNGFEMKTGARALFEGNVIENCWYSAQVCYSFSVAPINQQSGGATPVATCPTCTIRDFTYRYNYSYNVAYGIGIYAFLPAGCPTCQNQGGDRISIHDNVIGDKMNLGSLASSSTGDSIEVMAVSDSTGRGLNQLNNIDISHNTFVKAIRSITIFGGGTGQMHNWTMQNNVWAFGSYGFADIGSSGGCDTPYGFTNNAYGILTACVSNFAVDHNAVFNWLGGTPGAKWPTNGSGSGNFFMTGNSGVGFTNYGTGDSGFNPANYALTPSSQLHNAASDGTDIGADITTLLKVISGVRQ